VRTKKDVIDFTMGVVFGLGFEAAIGVWQWQIGPVFIPFFHVINDWRATGTLGVGNAFGCYIALLAPLSIRMAMFTSIKPKWLWYTISILSLGSLLASYTRGAWFAFIGSIIFFFYLDFFKRKLSRKQTVWLFVVLVVGVSFTSVKYGHIISGRMTDSKESLVGNRKHSRMGLAKDAFRIIKENPITGVGLNNYRYHADRETQGTRIVHNAYLLIAAQQGYPGIAIFLILNLTIFIYGFKLRKSRDPALYHIGMAAMTGLLALFIYHLVAPDYRLVIPKLHHWRAIAFIVALLIADERTRIIYRQLQIKKKRKTNGVSKSQKTIHNRRNETALQKY
jgi:O-antigen ligase